MTSILVSRYHIKKPHALFGECDFLCFVSKNPYNHCLYKIRNYGFLKDEHGFQPSQEIFELRAKQQDTQNQNPNEKIIQDDISWTKNNFYLDPYYIKSGIRSAIRAKKLDVVECLLPFVNARDDESEFLQVACESGHVGMVNLLIPHSNPKANHSACFRVAIIKGHLDVVNCLWGVVDVAGALAWFKENTEMFIDLKAVNERLKIEEKKNI